MTWILASAYGVFLVISGYALPSIRSKSIARLLGWSIAALTVVVSHGMTIGQDPLIRMIVIVFLQLLSMKALVAIEFYPGGIGLSFTQWTAFTAGWFGMKPQPFERLVHSSLPIGGLLTKALSRVLIGFILLLLSVKVETLQPGFFLPQLCLLAGISFVFHFGVLALSVAWWRMLGVDIEELFRAPYRSYSLKEFWGKRWNLAFSEMTALVAYRPLKSVMGTQYAMTFSFLFSGLLHEIAISLPVMSGFGLPMAYFAIHATAMQLEGRSRIVKALLTHRLMARVWVAAFLILPMPLLFHHQFVLEVMIPMRTTLLALVGF